MEKALEGMEVLFDDKFEQAGLPWKVGAGTGVLTRTVADGEWSTKGAAMKLTTSTVASQVTDLHRFEAKQPDARRYAFGGRVAVMDENIASLAFYLGFRDGTNWYRARLMHTLATDLWQYDAGGAGAQNLVTLLTRDAAESATQARWHDFLIVAVLDKLAFDRIHIDEQDYSGTVGGKPLRASADATVPNMLDFAVETTNLGGTPVAGVVICDSLYGLFE